MKPRIYDNKTLKSFNPLVTYATVLFSPRSVITNFKCFGTILNDFFFLQFFEKFHFLHIPIIHVDHPLDNEIPFTPEKVTVYLDFINFWVRPLAMLSQKFGAWHAGKLAKKWMSNFRRLYKLSAQVYRFRLTTTDRPNYKGMLEFRQIHALDPHYMCVPSLHVATVFLVYGFYRKLFSEENFTETEKAQWTQELYKGALEIIETVLYVKQHSVNCIPAALYMVVKNYSEYVTADDARAFINDMFASPEGFSAEAAAQIREHIRTTFEQYLVDGAKAENWYDPIREFLINYQNKEVAD